MDGVLNSREQPLLGWMQAMTRPTFLDGVLSGVSALAHTTNDMAATVCGFLSDGQQRQTILDHVINCNTRVVALPPLAALTAVEDGVIDLCDSDDDDGGGDDDVAVVVSGGSSAAAGTAGASKPPALVLNDGEVKAFLQHNCVSGLKQMLATLKSIVAVDKQLLLTKGRSLFETPKTADADMVVIDDDEYVHSHRLHWLLCGI